MIIAFYSIDLYRINNQRYPDTSTGLFVEIEAAVEYLIQLGDQYELNMDKILNHKAKDGTTVFWWAADYSEKLAEILVKRNTKVNTLGQRFETPPFRVSKRFQPFIHRKASLNQYAK